MTVAMTDVARRTAFRASKGGTMSRHPGTFRVELLITLLMPIIAWTGCTHRKGISFHVSESYQKACDGQNPGNQTVHVKAQGDVDQECVVISKNQNNFVHWIPASGGPRKISIVLFLNQTQISNLPFQDMSCSAGDQYGISVCSLIDCPETGGECKTFFQAGYHPEAAPNNYYPYAPLIPKSGGGSAKMADPGIRIDP
jgi:hypothetical protein